MLSFLLALGFVAPPAPSISTQIESYIALYARRSDFAGVVLVRQSGKDLFRKRYGYANREWEARHTIRSVFNIASLTKTFTAGAIYVLEKRGVLRFQDPLSKFLPNFPQADKIQILNLLRHTSGVGRPDMGPYEHAAIGLDQAVDLIAKAPFEFAPGTGNRYSNSGYTLLAKVIEVAAGKSYERFLRDEFFLPLGMSQSGNFGPDEIVPFRSQPYVPGPPPTGVAAVPGYDALCYLGAGSMWSTAEDLAKWLDAIESNRFFDLDKLDWPMGWGKRQYFDLRANEQTGMADGFVSGMIDFPGKKLQVIVLSNIQTQFPTFAVKDIAGIVLGSPPAKVLPDPPFVNFEVVDRARVVGHYALDEKTRLEIAERNGGFYYGWNGDRPNRYLAAIGKSALFARDEFATWTWANAEGFNWDGPFGKMELKRIR